MIEVVVYLTEDYSKNESIYVDNGLTTDEIATIVNQKFKKWYYFDVM